MKWLLVGALVGLGLNGCERCDLYVFTPLNVTYVNAAGAPLTPASLTIGATTYDCDAGSCPLCSSWCDGGTMIVSDLPQVTNLTLRAVATTGEVFSGSVTPSTQTTGQSCAGPTISHSTTVTLTAP